MKPFLLIATLLVLSCGTAIAQSVQGSKFNAGVELALPTGKFATYYNTGFGGSLKYEYLAGQNFYLSVSAGYITLPLTDSSKKGYLLAGDPRSSISYLPIKLGGKGFISNRLFLEAQLGNTFPINVNRLASPYASYFTFSPGVGCTFDNGLELGFRYEGWFADRLLSQYAFRVAYRFRL
jgi:hypothetical protein